MITAALPKVDVRNAPSSATVAERPAWSVLRTRSRAEKAVADVLGAAGIEFFLPLVGRMALHGGRRRRVEQPLFPGYLFLRAAREQTWFAADSRLVAQVIPAPDQARLAHEIEQIREALSRGGVLDPHAYLRVGRRVRVRSGPFQGIEGLVERRDPCGRLILGVHLLGQASSLEIDAGLLEPAD
jgi:transcription antitermination factor NusG